MNKLKGECSLPLCQGVDPSCLFLYIGTAEYIWLLGKNPCEIKNKNQTKNLKQWSRGEAKKKKTRGKVIVDWFFHGSFPPPFFYNIKLACCGT